MLRLSPIPFPDTYIVRDQGDGLVAIFNITKTLPKLLLNSMDDDSFDIVNRYMNSKRSCYLSYFSITEGYLGKGLSYEALELFHGRMREEGYEFIILTPIPTPCDRFESPQVQLEALLKVYSSSGYETLATIDYVDVYNKHTPILIKNLSEEECSSGESCDIRRETRSQRRNRTDTGLYQKIKSRLSSTRTYIRRYISRF